MDYTFVPMNDEQARAVAAWKYDGDYVFYNWTADDDDLAELGVLKCESRGDLRTMEWLRM